MLKSKVTAVVGGQFGSEGKGAVVQRMAHEYTVHIRTGGSNAGHTIYHNGVEYAMQVVPIGWINPNAVCVIGAGGVLDIDVLEREVNMILDVDPTITKRLIIDRNCGLILKEHKEFEGGVDGEMHKKLGSTGKGVGAARSARVMRTAPLVSQMYGQPEDSQWGSNDITFGDGTTLSSMFNDTLPIIRRFMSLGHNVLLEGTQGSGLSLIHGDYPYVTSADTNTAQMLADVGLSPFDLTDVVLVFRTFPIRVAGNSGALKDEVNWDYISDRTGKPTVEKTTVTKKVRRIGMWDESLFLRSVMINQPTEIAITFADYLDATCAGATKPFELSPDVVTFIRYVETMANCKVRWVGTSPNTMVDLTDAVR